MHNIRDQLKKYNYEDQKRSIFLFWQTAIIIIILQLLLYSLDNIVCQLFVSIVLGLTFVRIFIFYHDAQHRAIFRESKFHYKLIQFYGYIILCPSKTWIYGHTAHHKNNGSTDHYVAGEYPVISIECWHKLSNKEKTIYKFSRHPIVVFSGYFYQFLLLNCIKPIFQAPQRFLKQFLAALALHYSIFICLIFLCGPDLAVLSFLLPIMIACSIGSYLFYAQHNTPNVKYKNGINQDKLFSAINSTSYFKMSAISRWFCGNIGFHSVHHLIPTIPFYRLPEAFTAVSEFSQAPTTSWHYKDIQKNFCSHLWDQKKGKMLNFNEINE